MSSELKPLPLAKPSVYAIFYPLMRQVAYDHGYSIALHGSLQRDLDIIAVPWVDEPKSYVDMIKAFGTAIGYEYTDHYISTRLTDKPCGRKAINLSIGGECFIDLSIVCAYEEAKAAMGEGMPQKALNAPGFGLGEMPDPASPAKAAEQEPSEEENWLWKSMREVKEEVGKWPQWMKDMMNVSLPNYEPDYHKIFQSNIEDAGSYDFSRDSDGAYIKADTWEAFQGFKAAIRAMLGKR